MLPELEGAHSQFPGYRMIVMIKYRQNEARAAGELSMISTIAGATSPKSESLSIQLIVAIIETFGCGLEARRAASAAHPCDMVSAVTFGSILLGIAADREIQLRIPSSYTYIA